MIPQGSSRIDSIQGLRAVAALLVVVDHSLSVMIEKGVVPTLDITFAWMFGGMGVKIFFLISGFIMIITTREAFATRGASSTFWWKRFLRVAPLYWLATTLYAMRIALQGSPAGAVPLLCSYLFIPHADEAGLMQPVYGLGWTLNYEMFFYLLFGLALQFSVFIGMAGLIASLVGLVLAVHLGLLALLPSALVPLAAFWGDPIVIYFVGGVLIGGLRLQWDAARRLLPIGIHGALSLAIAGMAAYVLYAFAAFSADPNSVWEAVVCAGAVAFCGLAADARPSRGLRSGIRALGDASYSIYLTHGFLVGPGQRLWLGIVGPHGAVFFILTMLCTSGIVGLLTYRYVEKPLLGILRGSMRNRPVSA